MSTVALYSGGVDSYCMAYLYRPAVLLHVNMGGRYGDAETDRLSVPAGLEDRLVKIDAPLMGRFERADDKILPGRNAMLALLAANYGDDILLGSVASGTGNDKDHKFTQHMGELFDHIFAPQRWLPDGRLVRVHLPVVHTTKAQLVGEVLATGHDPEELVHNTFSCYEPTADHTPCGACPACGRKWAAFTVWGVDVGFDGKTAFQPYWTEISTGAAAHRSQQHHRDVLDAWHGLVRL